VERIEKGGKKKERLKIDVQQESEKVKSGFLY
jgi:hypothetical protein